MSNLLRSMNRLVYGKNVFISYPKSGRTWMRYVFHLQKVDVEFTHAGFGDSTAEIGEDFVSLDKSVLGRKNIFMHRNPLDTAVSMYFQVLHRSLDQGDKNYAAKIDKLKAMNRLPPKDIGEFVLHPTWGVENICKFNKSWLESAARNGFHIMTYEMARYEPEAEIAAVLKFLGVKSVDMQELLERTSFEEMKKLEKSGSMKKLRLGPKVNDEANSMKVRQGEVKGYKQHLTDDCITACSELASRYGFNV